MGKVMHGDAPTLFLHGGPGGCAAFERAHFGRSLPIHWWDQPRSVVLYPSPFGALVGAAEAELRLLAQRGGGPVDVVAHGFGATLALGLAARMPSALGRVVLLAPVADVGAAFVRFAMSLDAGGNDAGFVTAALAAFRERPDFARFGLLVDAVVRARSAAAMVPAQRRHRARAPCRGMFDRGVFDAVVGDAWLRPLPLLPEHGVALAASVHVVLGAADPMLDVDIESRRWAALCPAARFSVVPGGHFVHLDAPLSAWWPP
ncbi:alpha/beta fold hydrolase [Burkholderia pseudomultivorans]|nr:alpha/beta hydrolase [Burkholderia pseudomultivorans]